MNLINSGKVLEIKDGIIIASGLSEVGYNEKVVITNKLGDQIEGLALNLEADKVGIIVLGNPNTIEQGDIVSTTGKLLSIKVSESLIGRVIDPLGNPIDGLGPIDTSVAYEMPLDKIAPGVIERQDVTRPVQTGIIAVDSMTAIVRGQRQLIIGDRQTGKTAVAIDTILNQAEAAKKQGLPLMKCIYVA